MVRLNPSVKPFPEIKPQQHSGPYTMRRGTHVEECIELPRPPRGPPAGWETPEIGDKTLVVFAIFSSIFMLRSRRNPSTWGPFAASRASRLRREWARFLSGWGPLRAFPPAWRIEGCPPPRAIGWRIGSREMARVVNAEPNSSQGRGFGRRKEKR